MTAEYLRTRPAVLYGPLSTLLLLGETVRAAKFAGCRPRLIISTAEELREFHRRQLAATLCENVADFYGMSELGLLAWRGPDDATYTALSSQFVLEFLPSSAGPEFEESCAHSGAVLW